MVKFEICDLMSSRALQKVADSLGVKLAGLPLTAYPLTF